jgi:outer membrane receptor protein involved in Fe transport
MHHRTLTSTSTMPHCLRVTLIFLALAAAFPAHAAYAGPDLTSLSLEQLMDLKVIGASKYEQKQSEVAAAVSIITRDEIRTFGWRTLDQALASLPGIHTTYDRQYRYLGARGFGLPGDYNTRVLITINGNRTNDAVYDSSPTGWDFPLDLDLIERIEFIPGPGSAVYGQNAMFGVVNVITRQGAAVDGVELAGGWQSPQALREGRASFGKLLDNGTDVLLSVSGMRAQGEDHFFNFGPDVSGVAVGMDGEISQQFFGRIARGPWAFELIDGYRRKDDPTASYFTEPLVAGQYQSDHYTLAQARYEQSFSGDTLQLQARLFAGSVRFKGVYNFSGLVFDLPATSEWRGGELRLLYTAITHHKLMVGMELQNNTRIDQHVPDLMNPGDDRLISSSGVRTGLYAQDEWRIADTLAVTMGLRLDRTTTAGTAASPRLALIWQAAPATSLKALYGRAHRAPSSFERDYNDAPSQVFNPTLKGESIDTLELVADHRVAGDLTLRGSLYQWTMHDLITLAPYVAEIGLPQYQTGGTVNARGIELSADKTWTSGGRLRGSLSLQRAHYTHGAVLLNSPQLLGKLGFSSPLPVAGLRLGYELQYDSARRTIDGSDTAGYAVSNLHLSTDKWVKGLELGLGIRNLFDKRYSHPGADSNWQNTLEQDGRSVRLQATYKF